MYKRQVVNVIPNTPASEAEIRLCDLIINVNGTAVNNPSDVQLAVDRGQVGQPMPITIERDGATQVLSVRPRETPRRN